MNRLISRRSNTSETALTGQLRRGLYVLASLFALMIVSATAHAEEAKTDAGPLTGVPSGNYSVDLAHASVVWKVSHFGFSTYVGRFTDFSAELQLDSDDFSSSSVAVAIKTDSISTEYPFVEKEDFDKVLATEWFNAGDNPTITFNSTEVSALTDGKATVTGDMTMLGQTHPVTLDVTLNKATDSHPFKKIAAVGFSGTTSIDRTVWGLSKYAPGIGAQVKVEIEGEFLHTK